MVAGLKASEAEFERFKLALSQYPGAVDVWVQNWRHVEQLFNYRSAVRKMMYTTNVSRNMRIIDDRQMVSYELL